MTIYNLEVLNLALVEDNGYVRHTLEDLLRSFKIRRITSAANGAEAIEKFKQLQDPSRAGQIPDLVIADLFMAPVSGLLLLRWLRTAKESPNRFVPFLMLSGAADREYVQAARDAGATEFLAKPFSADSVYRHLLEIIDFPRQVIMSRNYFGPDRRRRAMAFGGPDQRQTRQEDVTIVYSQSKVDKPRQPSAVWYFRLPNGLRDKVGGLGSSESGEFPAHLIAEAEEKLQRTALDFTEWALGYLGRLSRLCAVALQDSGRRKRHFEEIHLVALELRGQGGTFGYPLVSIFAKMLFDMTGEGCREDDNAVEIVKAHVDAMRAVLREKIAGDGGQIGRDLLMSLQAAIDRLSVVR